MSSIGHDHATHLPGPAAELASGVLPAERDAPAGRNAAAFALWSFVAFAAVQALARRRRRYHDRFTRA
jgi:hypothetical protein